MIRRFRERRSGAGGMVACCAPGSSRSQNPQENWGVRFVNDYIFLMHGDVLDRESAESAERWEACLGGLRAKGNFEGGSSIGPGARFEQGQAVVSADGNLTGFLRVRAVGLEEVAALLVGNPVYEAGGTVEIRELPKD